MANLIPLSLIILSTYSFASGHHRGEQDIELSSPIMNFLSQMKNKDESNIIDGIDIDTNIGTRMNLIKQFIKHIEIDIPNKNGYKHNNTPEDMVALDTNNDVDYNIDSLICEIRALSSED